MPRMHGALPNLTRMPSDAAMDVVRAVFKEIREMYRTYNLLCVDMKCANILVECPAGGAARVRPADFGGYADPGSMVSPTFPIPWQGPKGLWENGMRYMNIASEEVCVYGIGVLFLELASASTDTRVYNMSHGACVADGHQREENMAARWDSVVDEWTGDARKLLEYASRIRSSAFDKTLQARTFDGLAEILFPENVIVIDD